MGEWKTFTIPLWKSENYFCPPVEKPFEITVDPSKIRYAHVYIDLNPTMPGWPGYGCVEGEYIYVNGQPIKYSGDACDKIEADIPTNYLKQGVNTIHFDIRASPLCFVSPQGNANGYLVIEVYVEPGEEPVKPPEETKKPCKIFGGLIELGEMDPSTCSTINTMMTFMILGIGAILLIKLIK